MTAIFALFTAPEKLIFYGRNDSNFDIFYSAQKNKFWLFLVFRQEKEK